MQAIPWSHIYSIFNIPFKSQNGGQRRGKLQKTLIFHETKNIKLNIHFFLIWSGFSLGER